MEIVKRILSPEGYMPHGYCYLWDWKLILLHAVSDSLILLAYLSIPFTLLYFVRRRGDLPFSWMFWCFGIFITGCGLTHGVEVWTLWHPAYWFAGLVKVVTAIASVGTAVLLVKLVPRALALPSPEALKREIAERKRAEAKFRSLLEAAPDAMVVMNGKGKILLVNAQVEKVFGYAGAELLDHEIKLLIPDEGGERRKGRSLFTESGAREIRSVIELRARHKEGHEFPVEVTLSPLQTEEGLLIVGAIRDITERKRAEASREQLASIVDHSNDAIIGKALDGTIVNWNQGAERVYGYSATEVVGKSISILLPPEGVKELPTIMARLERGETISREETLRRRKGGSLVHVSLITSPIKDARGQVVGASTIAHDISERKRAEEQLARERDLLHQLMDNSPDNIYFKDTASRFTRINIAQARTLGVDRPEEAIGKTDFDYFTEERAREQFEDERRILKTGEPMVGKVEEARRPDGFSLWVSSTKAAIRDANGNITGLLGISRDITVLKQAEDTIRRANEELEARVAERTAQLAHTNRRVELELAERRRADDALQKSEKRYRLLFERNLAGVCRNTLDGRILECNDAFARVFGFDSAEAMREAPARHFYFDPADRSTFIARLETEGSVTNYESRLRRIDGTPVWTLRNATLTHDDDIGAIVVEGTIIDITERKHAEELLRLRTEALEAAANTIVMTDRDGRIVWANAALTTLTGYSAEEVRGQNLRIFKSGKQDRNHYEELWNTILAGEVWCGEMVNRRKNGSFYTEEMTITPVRDEHSEISHFIAIKHDVTQRKRAEEAQRRSEERFRALVTATSDVVYRMGPDWSEMRELHGQNFIEDTEAPTCAWLQKYIHRDDQPHVMARIREAIRTQSIFELEHRVVRVDGSLGWTFSRAVPLRNANGEIVEWFGAAMDVTARKLAEQEIMQLNANLERRVAERTAELASANKELEAFTYSVAHDLRAPLRHIHGFARIFVEDHGGALSAEAKQLLTQIQNAATRMGRLVDDLLELARLGRQAMNWRWVDMQELVAEVVRELESEMNGRAIEWRVGQLPSVRCDRMLLKQALLNLLSNAVKYTRGRNPAVIEIGCTESDGKKAFFVRDNGVGFSMAYANKLFGVFHRLHSQEEFEGTGVGLAVVHRVCQRHAGEVWAESEPGKGATFYFTLGSDDEASGSTQNQEEALQNSHGPR
jgi:PAS domain S-box-containing protein